MSVKSLTDSNTALNTTDDDFIIVRCKMCNKILTEVTAEATGKIRQKCLKCKMMNKISLPLRTDRAESYVSGLTCKMMNKISLPLRRANRSQNFRLRRVQDDE